MEAHGDRIWAESDGPGQDIRFTFAIPAMEDAATRQYRAAGQAGETIPRVLAVDDDPETLRYVRSALSKAG